ncbi:MAG: hypothetical protein ACYDCO_16865 [Armatimonadota bacterium]
MSEPRSTDDLEFTKPAQKAMPVWAPNPGVPVISRILAYSFGAFMLITLFATCFTPRAADSPPIPQTEQDWTVLRTDNGCVLYYPRNWTIQQEVNDNQLQVDCSLIPGSPVQVTVLVRESTDTESYLAVEQMKDQLEKMLTAKLKDFALSDETLTTISSNGQAFNFTTNGQPMSGAWVMEPRGRFVLCVMGSSPRDSWKATELIVSHMAKKAECPK